MFPVDSIDTTIPTEYQYEADSEEKHDSGDRMKQNPLELLELDELDRHVKTLFDKVFKDKKSVTEEELFIGARLARNYANHERDPSDDPDHVAPERFTPSMHTVKGVLEAHDWEALEIQKSKKFWKEPKALLVTLAICCIAPMVQGWDQAANGNLGWPDAFGVKPLAIKREDWDAWEFGTVNAVLWFAAMTGPLLIDPFCNATRLGRRGSVLIAACLSLTGSIGGSRSHSWRQLLVWRVVLGVGIGAKAAIVPIWESEVLPPAKRGRVLVSWQVFVSAGLLTGTGATYLFKDEWRYQIMSGALPALVLLLLVYIGCESPRWLIVQERYIEAYATLIQLRKERLLAAEEFCYTYFQIQTERALARHKKEADFANYETPISYLGRVWRLLVLVRNRRALFATLIVMMSQQLSGINIFAFLGTNFYSAMNLDLDKLHVGGECREMIENGLSVEGDCKNEKLKFDNFRTENNLKLSLGFATATLVCSAIAYFLVEPLPVDSSLEDLSAVNPGANATFGTKKRKHQQRKMLELQRLLRGRRRLLLISMASGTAMLGGLAGLSTLSSDSPHKAPAVAAFVFFLAMCYSPGVGAVPFLYSAEVWPNEARDVGMSVGVFVNFFGAGMLTLSVPQALAWSPVGLFGIFTGLSTLGFLLIYFFVPCTNKAVSLEEMSAIFEHSLVRHAREQAKDALPSIFLHKNKKGNVSPYHPAPFAQPLAPQQAYSAPLPGQQQYPFPAPIQTQYGPYGYPPSQQMFYATPPYPQPYYSVPVPAQYSPHGSFSLSPQQSYGGHTFNEQAYAPSPTEPPTTSSYQPVGQPHAHFHPGQQ
ncbi:MFS general substrate transporter [Melanomma pulvis-pyrius CBS 109.77]|uniref:MFS general substrate transporter n=1 Tax=Melanomma pulvis-pyrius CBS 109.77 TaxID=1314802 RepID=A0A6A6X9S2_9PLEO|nr:MFS general substrate transporter [Melanomma pulvis-pyrius CBS 109.77]